MSGLVKSFLDRRLRRPAPAPAATRAPVRSPVSPRALLLNFQALGDNCEFGLVQRRAGAEPIGFFRFSYSRISDLVESLESGLAELDPPDSMYVALGGEYISPEGNEYIVRFTDRSYFYHTFISPERTPAEKVHAAEYRRIPFMRRKLLEELQTGSRMFVRKDSLDATPEDVRRLHRALRAYGPVPLLWVLPAEDASLAGTVEQLEEGLFRGYVDRFAPLSNAPDVSFDCWLRVCAAAYRLWKGEEPPMETEVQPGLTPEMGGVPNAQENTTLAPAESAPPLRLGAPIYEHRVEGPCNAVAASVEVGEGLAGGKIYSGSVWVWLPESFTGRLIAPVFCNLPPVVTARAVLDQRGRWQRLWVSARLPPEARTLSLVLWVEANPGDTFRTTLWKIEPGDHPTGYLAPHLDL